MSGGWNLMGSGCWHPPGHRTATEQSASHVSTVGLRLRNTRTVRVHCRGNSVCVCVCVCVYLLSLEHHTWWWLCLIEGGWQELGSSLENIGNKNIHFCNV